MSEQTPFLWPHLGNVATGRVSDAVERYSFGWPTECDGDSLAIMSGDWRRIVEVVQ